MALKRARQFGIKLESSEGVQESLSASDYSINADSDSGGYTMTVNAVERKFDRGALTRQKFMKGPTLLKIQRMIEAVGGTASTQAPWHAALQAAGFQRFALLSQTFATLTSGTAPTPGSLIGDNATQGSATKLARIMKYVDAGGVKKIWYYMITGAAFLASETIYGYDGGLAEIDPNAASAAAGHAFAPQTETESTATKSVTCEERIGGEVIAMVGARGTFKLMIKHGEPFKFDFELTGLPVLESDGASGLQFPAGSVVANVPSPGVPARVAKGMTPCLVDAYSPVFTDMTIDVGNQIAPRPTCGTGIGTVTDCGYMPPRITGRSVSASFDPEQPPRATFDFTRRMVNGSVHKFLVECGKLGDTPGIIGVIGPAVQFNGDATYGDRDGIVIRNPSVDFTGDQDDEIYFFHAF